MESMSTNTIIENMIRDNKIHRFSSELQSTNDEAKKILLREILKRLTNNNENEKSVKARNELSKMRDKFNENQMKKKWFRLSKEQKEEQIIKYLNETIEDDKKRDEEFEKLKKMLENDELENKFVIYNEKEGKIEELNYSEKKKVKKGSK
jgi:hypothetical protein